jgi:uncharacterized beta-barrel protein YwiB (DUF1934 family)
MEVVIRIRGEQRLDGACDTTELTARGTLEEQDGALVLTYCEEESDVTAAMRVTDTAVTIERRGAMQSLMRLEVGCHHACDYDTGYGVMKLDVYTSHLHNALTARGGTLSLCYTLDLGGGMTAEQTVQAEVHPLSHKEG